MRILFSLTAMLLFTGLFSGAQAQEAKKITVSGTITAGDKADGIEKGEPLVGVTISIKGTTRGTVTDIDGNFKLDNVAVGSKIVISYIGFTPIELDVVDGKTDYSVPLKTDSKELEEVVAVGYGVQKKRDVTGATVSVSEKDMRLTVNTGLDQALQGRTAGVNVAQTSGSPGAAASVNIRGVGSINGSQPLYVVDGVPVEFAAINLLNPNDIETMEVLKDASAAAIYGARGANGVVMITTKRGKDGKGIIEFEAQYGIQNVWRKLDVLNADQYRKFYQELYSIPDTSTKNAYSNNYLYRNYQGNTNWQDQIFRQGSVQNYNLSARGGNEYAKYAINMGYFNEQGTLRNSDFERYNFGVKTDISPKKWLTIGQSLSFSHAISRNGSNSTALSWASLASPLGKVYDENNLGGFGGQSALVLTSPGINDGTISERVTGANDFINPVAVLFVNANENQQTRMLGNIYMDIKPHKNIKWTTRVGADFLYGKNYFVGQPFFTGNAEGRFRNFKEVSDGRTLNHMLMIDHTLSYSKTINKHSISALAGFSSQSYYSSGVNANGLDYPEQINTIGASLRPEKYTVGGIDEEYALLGYLARANYSYSDKYLATINFRYDGSSRFGQNTKYGLFPSASVGWRISNEEFMKSTQWISDLKLRAGWGRTGNQDLTQIIGGGNYLFTQVIYPDIIRYPLGSGQAILPAAAPTRGLANPNLRWETVEQWNGGVDFAILQNSIILNLDFFRKTSSGMLIPVPIPATSGVTNAPFFGPGGTYFTNAGSVLNQGVEYVLTYRNEKRRLKFTISPNGTLMYNKVTALEGQFSGGRPNIPGGGGLTRTEPGAPIGSFFGWVPDGVIQNDDELKSYYGYLSGTHQNVSVGDLRFKDIDGDGRLTDNDRTFIGSPIPRFTYGLNVNMNYQGFDFKMFFQGVEGVQIWNAQRTGLEAMRGPGGAPPDANQSTSVLERWTPSNPSNTMPRAVLGDPAQNTRPSARWVESGDYLRLKSIQLGYNFSDKWLKKTFTTEDNVSLRLYIGAQNLLTFTKYTGYDPELASFNPIATGIDGGNYPQARRFFGGLQFTF